MQLDIAFDAGLRPSEFLKRRIETEARRLERVHSRLQGLQVVVSGPSGRRRHGDHYSVHLRVKTPGGEDVVIARQPDADRSQEDPYIVIRDAFAAARRQLRERKVRRDGKIKSHTPSATGKIARLSPDGFGFIDIENGPEVYFHRNALRNEAFEALMSGARVRLTMSETDGRLQASSIHVLTPK